MHSNAISSDMGYDDGHINQSSTGGWWNPSDNRAVVIFVNWQILWLQLKSEKIREHLYSLAPVLTSQKISGQLWFTYG